MIRGLLLVAWLTLGAVPLLWWLRGRRRVDLWAALPVPAALLDADGSVVRTTGPASDVLFDVGALPARGRMVRARNGHGLPLALTGLPGGALALALPADPVGERRDRVLAELGARLAHDINTPLAAVVGHLDLIAHQPINETTRMSLRTCQRELARLQTTAGDLLAFTRLRAGGGGTRSLQLAGALVEDAAAAFLDAADETGVEFSVEVPHERVAVHASEGDLVRALRNLIANAFRHGLTCGRDVVVSAEADEQSVTFAVADRGPGLTTAELAALSEPTVRGPGVTGAGSGLGLAIVGEVLSGHGASLATSPRDGGGGVLSFTLPRAR